MSEQTITSLKIEISSDTKNTDSALESLINRLEKLEKICDGTSKAQNKNSETAITHAKRLNTVNNTLNKVGNFMRKFTAKCGEWFRESNDYIESLNLFNVSMGSGAYNAQQFAESIEDIMGLDLKEWMNYQGSFNQIFEGFGLDDDISFQMSQQLTQLSYDLSSYANIPVENAFKKIQSGISGQIKGLKEYGINLSVAQLRETALAHGIELSTAKMTERQKATLRYISLMEQTQNIQNDMARTIATPSNSLRILESQFIRLKRALGNIVSVLVVDFIPVVRVAVKLMTDLANKIAIKAGWEIDDLNWDTVSDGADNFSYLDDSILDASNDSEKLKKSLLGFDELNILQDNKNTASSLLGGGLPDDLGLHPENYSYDFTQGLESFDTSAIEETLRKITLIASGALFAIGAVLTFTGANIPLGIALMIAGATGIVTSVALNWNETNNKVGTILSVLTGIVGGASLALGALLALTGVATGLGIALIVVGAATLVTAVAINWNSTSDKVNEIIDIIAISVSSAMLVIGMILLLASANFGLGVAMIAAGALTLASEIAIDWNTMPEQIKSVITTITSIVGGALLAVGAALAITGVSIPLGIALIAAGAVSIVASVALNWDTLPDNLGTVIQIIAGVVGGALLVIGAILTFSGFNIPLGIALLAAGAVSLAVSVGLNWDTVKDKITNFFNVVGGILSAGLAVLGVILCLTGGFLPLGIALIYAGYKGVQKTSEVSDSPILQRIKSVFNSAIEIVNGFIRKVNSISIDMDFPDWLREFTGWSGAHIGFNIPEVSYLASGGQINSGQFFVAREAGPELVGTIGNKSAVVNNDQIVASVEGGVYRGVRDALSENGNTSNGDNRPIYIIIDSKDINNGFVNWHNNQVKVNGRSPLNV